MDTLAERLRYALDKRRKTAADLARAVPTTESTVSQWLAGEIQSMRSSNLLAVCDYLRINPLWLGKGQRPSGLEEQDKQIADDTSSVRLVQNGSQEQSGSGETVIRQYDTGGSMGAGLVLRDQPGVIRSFNVSREWIEKNLPYYTSIDNLCIVTGFGDSMLGLFNPGDPLIVDRGISKADVDGVYFFRVGDEGFIKRLQRIPGEGIVVISENPKYRDWTIKPDMDFAVMGKVLVAWQGHKL